MKPYRLRTLLLILFLCFAGLSGSAQAPNWQHAVGGVLQHSIYGWEDMKVDTIGNLYKITAEVSISKYSPNGIQLWSKNIPAESFSKDAAGNVYLTGVFSGNLQLDNITLSCSNMETAIFITKLDPAGNVVWAVKSTPKGKIAANDAPSLFAYTISTDSAGNSLVAGYSYGNLIFDSITLAPTSWLYATHFIIKFNPDGVVEWMHENKYSWARALAFGPLNSHYVIGLKSVQKFSENGMLLWEKEVITPPSRNNTQHNYLAVDKQGNCFVSGITNIAITFDSLTLKNSGLSNNYLVKYSNSGKMLWAKINKNLTDSSQSWGGAIKVNNGQVYVTGSFSGTTTFDKRLPVLSTAKNNQVFVAKLSADTGMPYWMKQTTQAANADGWAIESLSNGESIIAGLYNESGCTFDNINLPPTPNSNLNFFIAKLSVGSTVPLEPIIESDPEPNPPIGFQVFPNPAMDIVSFNAPGFENSRVFIYNTAGQKIYSSILSEQGKTSINISNWASGMYMCLFQANGQQKTKKLIVIH